MISFIPTFSSVHLLIVGDVMLDRYWYGVTSRISPEAPVPVVCVKEKEERPGGAGNVALNVAALGGHVTLMGITGKDEAADTIRQQLVAQGIRCAFVESTQQATITKLRILSRHQQLIRLDFESEFAELEATKILNEIAAYLAATDIVILSDYSKGTLRQAPALIQSARVAHKPILIDPKGRDFSKYRGATLITPNLGEFEAVVGACATQTQLVEKGEALRKDLQLEALLITRGHEGMTLIQRDQTALHLPAYTREVFDVTGAGDTTIAVLAATLAAGRNLTEATRLANLAASLSVGKLGAATVSVAELEQALRDHQKQGICDVTTLQSLVKTAKTNGETIVMTNGCFDILHAGHVRYLAQAKQLGHRLIVAVNEDDSVRRLKGSGRPINTLSHRMMVLNALECVDWVVPFMEDTPAHLICQIQPDVLVKGGDYQVHQIVGSDCVLAKGGRVCVLDWLEGCSTTAIITALAETAMGEQ
jgi:D-beta-D-heptose 7-phosphate kinase/D-beta-D-heptose 1-phosphate adenosyltransferase